MVPSCAEGGVLGILCASIASVMGTEAIKLITGIGEPLLGRLMVYDALDMTYRTIKIRKDPGHAEDHRADRLRGVLRRGVRRGGRGRGRLHDHPARAARAAGLRQATSALIDVREPVEWDINHIDGAELIPKSSIESGEGLAKLPRSTARRCCTARRGCARPRRWPR